MYSPMKIFRPILAVVILMFCMLPVSAQQARRQYADKLFKIQEYYKAAPYYEDVARITIHTDKDHKKDWDAVRRTAICYRYTNDFVQSEKWYQELQKAGKMTEQDIIDYIEVLRYNGKHQKAQEYITREAARYPGNEWLQEYTRQSSYLAELQKDSALQQVRELEFNSGMGDFAPAFYNGGLVYASQRRNTGFVNVRYSRDNSFYLDCYMVERNKKTGELEKNSQLLNKVFRTKAHDGPISFNAEGNVAFITRNDTRKHKSREIIYLKLYISHKQGNGKWSKPEEFKYNSPDKSYSVGHAILSADGNTLYFASDMPGGMGGVDIWKCERDIDSWHPPVNLGNGVNTARNEMFPFIADNGVLYFASNGHIGLGGLDIFKSVPENGTFGPAKNMGYPVNSFRDDFGLILDSTHQTGFFSSNRKGNTDYIYSAVISDPQFILAGTVVNNNGRKSPLSNVNVEMKNITTGEVSTFVTDSLGKFSGKLQRNNDYEITAGKESYLLVQSVQVSTMRKTRSETLTAELLLEPTTISFTGRVIDKQSREILKQVQVMIKDRKTDKEWLLVTDENGLVTITIDRNHEYGITGRRKGYLAGDSIFHTSDREEETKIFELELEKIKEGIVFTVKDIYYDYNKWNLRDTSKSELDKLAAFLLENNHIKVELSSHTDSRGTDSYNEKLSQKRAQSCVDYLIWKGVPAGNIVAKGYGESKPINHCVNGVQCTEDEYQKNRRTEIKILKVNISE